MATTFFGVGAIKSPAVSAAARRAWRALYLGPDPRSATHHSATSSGSIQPGQTASPASAGPQAPSWARSVVWGRGRMVAGNSLPSRRLMTIDMVSAKLRIIQRR
jgi:hypothetical protein